MYLVYIVIVLVASATSILMLQRNRSVASTRIIAHRKKDTLCAADAIRSGTKSKFRGFVIEPGSDCCQASSELQRVTFFYRDRFSLPLPGCDKAVCTCKRAAVTERRKHHRRFSHDRRSQLRFDMDSEERRIRRGRREQDNIWSGGYRH